MSNRVDELESQVAELKAAVDGLTEELVETRERLSQLEADEGVDHSRTPDRRDTAVEPDHAEVEHASDPEPDESADEAADAESEADAETEADDDDSSDGNDIIVA